MDKNLLFMGVSIFSVSSSIFLTFMYFWIFLLCHTFFIIFAYFIVFTYALSYLTSFDTARFLGAIERKHSLAMYLGTRTVKMRPLFIFHIDLFQPAQVIVN